MPRTMKDILGTAAELKSGKEWVRALKIYRLVLEAVPQDHEVRLEIGDALMAMGEEALAEKVWTETCRFDILSGQPMQAIVAAKRLIERDRSFEKILRDLAMYYNTGSERVGRTARQASVDLDVPVRDDVNLDYAVDPAALAKATAELVIALGQKATFPEKVPPLPIMSDLTPELFQGMLGAVKLLRLPPGSMFLREGENADTFFMLARGKVRIWKSDPNGRPVELAKLGEGSILGEMALLTSSPRTASVETITDADLLVFSRADLDRMSEESIQIEAALDRFTRERLISNLLATNPLFSPFDRKQRFELLSRFTVHEVVPGTVLVKQGSQGQGLFIILYGEVEVMKREGEEDILLATLRAGDVFGEISLIKETPTTATVRALRHSTLLFLPSEYFKRIVSAITALHEYFDRLSEQRLSHARETVEKAQFLGSVDVVFDDERIMI